MSSIGLTFQQDKLLAFIKRRMQETGGVSPSFEEMTAAMGLASKSGIHRIITGLEERGAIRRITNRPRAIEVIEPDRAQILRVNLLVALDGLADDELVTVATMRALVMTSEPQRESQRERRTDRQVGSARRGAA